MSKNTATNAATATATAAPKNGKERKAHERALRAESDRIVAERKAQEAPAPAPAPIVSGHAFPARPVPTEKPAPEPAESLAPSGESPAITAQRATASLLKNVADPTRLAVIHALAQANSNVTDLMVALGMRSQPALSHHLALMRHCGTVDFIRDGKNSVYFLTEKGQALFLLTSSLNV